MAITAFGNRLERSIRERAGRAGGLAAVSMQTRLRSAFGPHRKSGDTQRATTVRLESATPTRLTYIAKAETPQARYVNDGTPAHVITPKANRSAPFTGGKWPRFISGEPLLVFFWPVFGRVVRFRWVDHPGYKGDNWWDRTIEEWPDVLAEAFDRL